MVGVTSTVYSLPLVALNTLKLALPAVISSSVKLLTTSLKVTVAVKAALYMAVKDAGIKNTELAKRLGADEKEVRRLLDN